MPDQSVGRQPWLIAIFPAGQSASRVAFAWALIAPIAVATVAAMIWPWPHGSQGQDSTQANAQCAGQLSSIESTQCAEEQSGEVNGCGSATVRLDDPDEDVTTDLPNGPGAPEVADGDKVIVVATDSPDGTVYSIVDHQRGFGLLVFGGGLRRRASRVRPVVGHHSADWSGGHLRCPSAVRGPGDSGGRVPAARRPRWIHRDHAQRLVPHPRVLTANDHRTRRHDDGFHPHRTSVGAGRGRPSPDRDHR